MTQPTDKGSHDPVKFHVGLPSPTIANVQMTEWSSVTHMCVEGGFECMWHSNERFYREMWIRMTVAALSSDHMGIGGAIADPFSVHPLITAQALATMVELSNGRATIAMGAGGSGFKMMGIRRSRSAVALKDALSIMRAVLRGETVTYKGDVIQAHEAQLQFTPVGPVDLWIATRGDRTLEVGGEVADGVMIATYADAESIGQAVRIVEKGAARSGRSVGDLRLMARVDTCVHEDPSKAYDGVRPMIAKLLWASYPDRRFVERMGLTVPEPIEARFAERDYAVIEQVAGDVPDEFAQRLSWSGAPETVAERVATIVEETGVREIGFWILPAPNQPLKTAIETVAGDVIPRVKSLLNMAAE
jgi:5,10-methylenetetrahydromethanopterin reductase